MRVAFFGTPAYAVPTLDALVEAGHEVVTVVAQPDKPVGRGKKLQSPPVVVRARELGLETRQPKGVRRGPFPENYGKLDIDVAVVVAYGRILTPHLLNVPKRGCINGHGSLLPRWRGAGPIQWALLSGDTQTGVCTMQMDEGMDTGDVLLREAIDIGPDETQTELAERLAHLTARLIVQTLAQLDDITPQPQPTEGITHARMLTKEDALLDFSRPAKELHDQVRGLNPWPGTQCAFRGGVFKVKTARWDDGDSEPGVVQVDGKRLFIGTGSGRLEVLEGQLPGKPKRKAADLINGGRMESGEKMGDPA